MADVSGYCPMGCGKTLFVGSGGYITCSWIDCPKPDAVSILLEEDEHEHVVVFTRKGWTIQHPLRDRVEGVLFDCPATKECEAIRLAPAPGTYRMSRGASGWDYTLLEILND